MTLELTEEPMTALPEYARIPIIFTVDRVLDVTNRDDGPGGFALSECRLEVPYEKDYDAIVGEGPLQWAGRFDLSNWWAQGCHFRYDLDQHARVRAPDASRRSV
jgi:hypothetical protein